MVPASDDLLFGRIALHYKLVTREQLVEATQFQAREGGERRLGEILKAQGILTPRQVEQVLVVQREYVAKQQAQTAPAPPEPLQAQEMPALTVQPMPALTVAPAPPAAIPSPPPPAAAPAATPGFTFDTPRGLDRLRA